MSNHAHCYHSFHKQEDISTNPRIPWLCFVFGSGIEMKSAVELEVDNEPSGWGTKAGDLGISILPNAFHRHVLWFTGALRHWTKGVMVADFWKHIPGGLGQSVPSEAGVFQYNNKARELNHYCEGKNCLKLPFFTSKQ
jgi:hypothetical protein